jgi:hypothetical protein
LGGKEDRTHTSDTEEDIKANQELLYYPQLLAQLRLERIELLVQPKATKKKKRNTRPLRLPAKGRFYDTLMEANGERSEQPYY